MTVLLNYGVTEEERTKTLNGLTLHDLRDIGRAVGVQSPTSRSQADLISAILDVEYGRVAPTNSRRGRKPKSKAPEGETAQAAESKQPAIARTVRGVVTLQSTGEGVLTPEWLAAEKGPVSFALADNVKISAATVLEAELRTGDVVVGVARTDENGGVALYSVGSVNGRPSEEAKTRVRMQSAFGGYPTRRILLSACSPRLRVADLLSPMGYGSRALVVTPAQTETERVLREMIASISQQTKHVYVLFNEEYPEDAAEFSEDLLFIPVLLEYGRPAESRLKGIRLLFEHVKRLAEGGDHAVLVIPSLTKLALTANEAMGSATLSPACYGLAKEIFGGACTLQGAGSLTVIMGGVSSAADDVATGVYDALSGAANVQFAITKKDGKTVVSPALCYTKKAEKLLSERELTAAEFALKNAEDEDYAFLSLLENAKSYEDGVDLLSQGRAE